jgi:hypothetical protein
VIKVRTWQFYAMKEMVVERECHEIGSRLSISSRRNRRSACAGRCAEYEPVAGRMHVRPAAASITSVTPEESTDAVGPPFGETGDVEPPNAGAERPAPVG